MIAKIQTFQQWIEMAASFDADEYNVYVDQKYLDQPTLTIHGWGQIRLFLNGDHWVVHSIHGDKHGAGTLLYFAALLWVLTKGDEMLKQHKYEPTYGKLASDLTLSPDGVRARQRIQNQYGDYIYMLPHPNIDSVKVHRGDKTDWRRPATAKEATMWRLKKMPPWQFNFI